MRSYTSLVLLLFMLTVSGCSAMQTYSEYADLDVRASTLKPVFLRKNGNKLFVRVDCPVQEWAALESNLTKAFAENGYIFVPESILADVILDIRIHNGQMAKHSARAVQGGDYTAAAGTVAGGVVGHTVSKGDPLGTVGGMLGGMVVGGIADITINTWAHLGILEARADILALENMGEALNSNVGEGAIMWRETETGVIVKAKQAGMKWEEAAPKIEESMIAQIVSILPQRK